MVKVVDKRIRHISWRTDESGIQFKLEVKVKCQVQEERMKYRDESQVYCINNEDYTTLVEDVELKDLTI